MTAYTSAATGNWSTPTNWSPAGLPGNGDTVTIGHNITVDTTTIIGTSPAEGNIVVTVNSGGGALTVASGISFTVRGAIALNNAPMTMSAGSTLEFDASLASSPSAQNYELRIGTGHNQTSARLNINGTSGSRVTIRSNSGGGNGWINDGTGPWLQGGLITGSYVDFLRIGDSSNDSIRQSPTSSATFYLTDATFTDCGRIGGTYNMGATCSFTLQRINMTNTQHSTDSLRLENAGGYTSGTRLIDDCVFDKEVHFYTGAGFTVTNNFFGDTVDSTAGDWVSCTGNLFQSNDNLACGGITSSYFLYTAATDNPHYLQPNTTTNSSYSYNVFEAPNTTNPIDAGDCLLLPSVGSTTTYTMEYNVVVPAANGVTSGCLFSGLGNGNWRLNCNHNTWYLTANDPTSNNPALGTAGETHNTAAGQITSFKSNIAASSASRNAYLLRNVNGAPNNDVVTAANADYNLAYNMLAGSEGKGYNLPVTGSPGANDLAVDPQFVDPTRNAAKWDLSLGGAGTAANAVTELKRRHKTGYNSNYTINSLWTYVRAGFAPTNALLDNAAHDGTDIGAIEGAFSNTTIQLPAPTTITFQGYAPEVVVTGDRKSVLPEPDAVTLAGYAPSVQITALAAGGAGGKYRCLTGVG